MKRFVVVVLSLVGGYVAGALGGHAAVQRFSANTHDRAVEAAMTGAFVTGPLGAIVGGVVGFMVSGRTRRTR